MARRNWYLESFVAATWWANELRTTEDVTAEILGSLLNELDKQSRNPEIEVPSLRIALRIDAPCTPVRKMTMHIAADSVRVYTGFASEGQKQN
jgi:hypothetical protein